uniref:AIG1-type G domain-containing protein n=1 Tax=Labrus bergylta TaxID=56723 RepID=A0A3Q3FZX8_9LABR
YTNENTISKFSDDITIPKLQIILLGSRGVGKTSVGNVILGIKDKEDGKTTHSVAQQGFVNKTDITVVDTPGWWKDFLVCDTPVAIREELMLSMFLCRPGPHVFLLMIDSDASFNHKHLEAVKTHMELLGKGVWGHTIVVFTRGDWLGAHSIEEYIEGEGEALQILVQQCGNRYHVIDNKNKNDTRQVTELFEKIEEMVAGNSIQLFCPDMDDIQERLIEMFRRRQIKQLLKQSFEETYRRRELELLTDKFCSVLHLQLKEKIQNQQFLILCQKEELASTLTSKLPVG